MTDRRGPSGTAAGPRLTWTVFWAASVLALGACVTVALATAGRSAAALVLLGGLLVVGLAGALLYSLVSPLDAGRHVSYGGGGLWGGGVDGSGSGSGGGGGDGGCT